MDSILRASNLIDVEALLNDRRKPPPLTRQVGRGADTDDLECVAALARGEVVGLGGVHHLLRNLANRGGGARFPEGLPVQSSASPFGRFRERVSGPAGMLATRASPGTCSWSRQTWTSATSTVLPAVGRPPPPRAINVNCRPL